MPLTPLPPVTPVESTVAAIGGVPRAVWLLGEHDMSTDSELAATIARAISLDDDDLVLDLSMVEFIGASTISVIVAGSQFLRARSRSLTIRSPSGPARRVLDLCGLSSLLDASYAAPPAGTGALSTWVDVPRADRVEAEATSIAVPADADTLAGKTTPARPGPVVGASVLLRLGL